MAGCLRSGRRKGGKGGRGWEGGRREGGKKEEVREERRGRGREGGRQTRIDCPSRPWEKAAGEPLSHLPRPPKRPLPPPTNGFSSTRCFICGFHRFNLDGDLREDNTHLFDPWLCTQHPPSAPEKKSCRINQINETPPSPVSPPLKLKLPPPTPGSVTCRGPPSASTQRVRVNVGAGLGVCS